MKDTILKENKRNKLFAFFRHNATKKIAIGLLGIISFLAGRWYDKNQELDYLRREINFNINELQEAADVLDKFEKFLDTEFHMEEKKRIFDDEDDMPPRLFHIDSSNKDNPIWKLNRSTAQSRNYVIKKFSEEGKITAIKNNKDIKFLEGLDSEISKINNTLIGVYTSIDELTKRSKSVSRKEKLEDLRRDIDNKRKNVLAQVKQIKTKIDEYSQKLKSIRDSVQPGFFF
jgi:hypothetical protein